jgi:hypothetical protein
VGYDEYFIVDVKAANTNLIQPLNILPTMTKKTMAKEFIKHSGRKSINRVMLSKFIERIISNRNKAA